MDNLFRRLKKDSVSEIEIDSKLAELNKKIDCLQMSEARLRQDIRQILREEIRSILNERNRKAWWNIA